MIPTCNTSLTPTQKMSNLTHNYVKVKDQNDLDYNKGKFWDDNSDNVFGQLGSFERSVAIGLNDVHRLYYPAGGMLYYNDPVFARNGDLQTSLRLNPDAIPGENRNPTAEKAADPKVGDTKSPTSQDDPQQRVTLPKK